MARIYMDMLELFLFPQIDGIEQGYESQILFQQDSAPPQCRCEV
jgi:hypothetical protein